MIPETIDDAKNAFMECKNILDSFLVANEVVEDYRCKGKSGHVFKLDFAKAYDHIDRGFLNFVFRKKGFGEKWRRWMTGCSVWSVFGSD